MTGADYHVPVLMGELLEHYVSGGGVYVDGTLGGGGHFRAVAEKLSELSSPSVLIGIDRDTEAVERAKQFFLDGIKTKIIIEKARFSEFDKVLSKQGIERVNGLFVDLGVSSRQIDEPARGFAYMKDAPLDMRMDQSGGVTAAEFLANAEENELTDIFETYGEIKNAQRLAGAIKMFMRTEKMETSADLKKCIEEEYGKQVDIKLIAKLFQSLRIAINEELTELRTFLEKSITHLSKGGRVAVISYHSLEDRMVKEFFKKAEAKCICDQNQLICTCNKKVELRRINRKAITSSEEEIKLNPRSRSARLRVAERC